MSDQTEKIEWYYISEDDYQSLNRIRTWSTSGINPFESTDFNKTFPSISGYRFARKIDIDQEELDWADMHDIIIRSAAFAESNQSGFTL